MRTLLFVGTLFAVSTTAHAAQLLCTTNVTQDSRQPSTSIRIESGAIEGQAEVTIQTRGGMAHFVTAPRTFSVAFQSHGPEVVEFYNSSEDFELTVTAQPIVGVIHGSYTGDVMGRRVQTPVICTHDKIIPLGF